MSTRYRGASVRLSIHPPERRQEPTRVSRHPRPLASGWQRASIRPAIAGGGQRASIRPAVAGGRQRGSIRAAAAAGMILAIAGLLAGSALAQEPRSHKPQQAPIPCDQEYDLVLSKSGPQRVLAARSALIRDCPAVTSMIVAAIEDNTWPDGESFTGLNRSTLLGAAVRAGHADAETLAVRVLETGMWSPKQSIQVKEGVAIIQDLQPALTPYRTRLLLDIFEQVNDEDVQIAVVRALRGSSLPEALLPALDAYWNYGGRLHDEAAKSIEFQPENDAGLELARVIRALSGGPSLSWAARLAETDNIAPAQEALREKRGN